MPIIDVEQNSDEWLRMRAGCCTGSRVKEAITKTKAGKYSEKRQHYIIETCFGRITGLHLNHYVTEEMRYGLEQEKLARAEYEMKTGCSVEVVGLAQHERIKWFCASPDGLVLPDRFIEIKVPKPSTHLEWMWDDRVPEEHEDQMNAVMACEPTLVGGDFVSYCPILPEHLQLFIKPLLRVQAKIEKMEKEVELFLVDVEKAMERFGKNPAPIPTLQEQLDASLVMIGMETQQ